jgi:hypothetical protein
MLSYLILKRRSDWREIFKRNNDVSYQATMPNFRDSMFGYQFKEFVETSLEMYKDGEDNQKKLFMNNNIINQ